MSIAAGQLRAFIDRILRLKEEQDAIGDDIKEVYAEAKANGFDKTQMGRVVAHLRAIEKKGRNAVAESEEIFDLYLNAYHGGEASHTHAREEVA